MIPNMVLKMNDFDICLKICTISDPSYAHVCRVISVNGYGNWAGSAIKYYVTVTHTRRERQLKGKKRF